MLEKVGKGLSWEQNWISSDVHFGKVTFFVALSREWREGQVEGRAGTRRSCVKAADAERRQRGMFIRSPDAWGHLRGSVSVLGHVGWLRARPFKGQAVKQETHCFHVLSVPGAPVVRSGGLIWGAVTDASSEGRWRR